MSARRAETRRLSAWAAPSALGLLFLGCVTAAGWGGVGKPLPIDAYLAWLGGAFAAYAGLVRVVARRPRDRRLVQALMALAAAAWLVMLAAPARRNSDVWRYLWDGHVLASGHNPYASAPADFAGDRLNAPGVYAQLNPAYNRVRTVYGPAAALVFAAASRLPGGPFALRAGMTLAAFLCAGLLAAWLRKLRLPESGALLFIMNPLTLDSFAQRGQMDALMLAPLLACLLLASNGRMGWAGLVLGLAVHTKVAALAAAPVLLAQRKAGRRFAAAFVLALLAGAIPLLIAGPRAFEGYVTFASQWRTNGSLFPLLAGLSGEPAARVGAGALVIAAWACAALWARRQPERLPVSLLTSFLALLLVAPAVFPWYVTWLLPLTAAVFWRRGERALAAAALTWSATALLWYLRFLAYPPLDEAAWPGFARAVRQAAGVLPEPWRALEYGVPLAVALGVLRRSRRACHSSARPTGA